MLGFLLWVYPVDLLLFVYWLAMVCVVFGRFGCVFVGLFAMGCLLWLWFVYVLI